MTERRLRLTKIALLCLIAGGPHVRTAAAQTPAAGALSLTEATNAALANNPGTRAAQQQLTQAQEKLAQAQAQQRYQITFSSTVGASNARVIQPPPSQESFGTLVNTVTIPLPVGKRPALAVRQADEQLAAAQAQFAGARLTLAGQVGTAYYNILRQQALLRVAQDNQATAQRQQSDAEKRFRAGEVPEIDVLRARVPVASAEAARYQAQSALDIARQTLNGLLGKPLDETVSVADVPVAVAPSAALPITLEEARTLAVKNSPDVQAADATVRAQELARQSAGLSREPAYAVQASDTRSNDLTSFSRLDNIQATVTIPLSDGGLAKAQVREAEAALAQARAQADVARRTVLVAVSGAYLTAQSSLKQIDAARTAQEIAQQTYDKTTLGYRSGLFPLTDVLNAQAALNQARIAYTQAVYDAAAATTTLNNAIGNLPK